MTKTILITGGTGFIGSNLCKKLIKDENNRIICVDNNYTGSLTNIEELLDNPRFSFIEHDIINPLNIDAKIDEIYNLACPASPPAYQGDKALFTTKTCVYGAINMLELARKNNAKILQSSTSEVYGEPLVHPQIESYRGNVNPNGIRACYDEGKRCAESLFFDYHRIYGVRIKVIRIFNTYGPMMDPNDGRVVSNFICQALRGEDLTIYGDGSQTRSFCYIDDLVDVIIKMMASDDDFLGPVNTGNPGEFTIKELAELVRDKINKNLKIIYKPLPSDDPTQRKPDITLAKQKLGWEPKIKLAEGLDKTIEYFDKKLKGEQQMKVCVIGTGYVGLVVGTCLAEMGNDVICVDNNEEKLNQLKNGIIPIYEPGLEELIKANVSEQRLTFTSDIKSAVAKSLVCFIAVGTPQGEDGSADLKYVREVAKSIGQSLRHYTVIVDKSTVPVGTADLVTAIIKEQTNIDFDVVSNPEFLKQGAAVDDFLKPDRVVIGSNSQKATEIMQELYAPFLRTGNPVIIMDVKSAEMTKYAANSFLAVKISYANEIANICEKVGADAEMVRIGMCSDKRIGSQFLFPGLGYGGSCFPKDVKALTKTAVDNGCDYTMLKAADEINKKQRQIFIDKILKRFGNNLNGKTFAIWGLAFKPKTNDMREAPAITIINALLERGAKVQTYDPKAFDCAQFYFKDAITYSKSAYSALENADCLLLLTEWNEFRRPDFDKIKSMLKNPVIFDGRNQYNPQRLQEKGFEYYCIGKKQAKELVLV